MVEGRPRRRSIVLDGAAGSTVRVGHVLHLIVVQARGVPAVEARRLGMAQKRWEPPRRVLGRGPSEGCQATTRTWGWSLHAY